jgi:hypothetical protein
MANTNKTPLSVSIIRWVARGWSILALLVALMIIFTPDPYATSPVPAIEWFILSLWGVAILGLLVAWRWEFLGGVITIGIMVLREIIFFVAMGYWVPAFLLVWILVIPPAILFILAAHLSQPKEQKPA